MKGNERASAEPRETPPMHMTRAMANRSRKTVDIPLLMWFTPYTAFTSLLKLRERRFVAPDYLLEVMNRPVFTLKTPGKPFFDILFGDKQFRTGNARF